LGHTSLNELNFVKIDFEAPEILNANSSTGFYLEFPSIFSSDLGTGLVSGNSIPCEAESGGASVFPNLRCTLFIPTNPKNLTRIYITGFDSIPSGT